MTVHAQIMPMVLHDAVARTKKIVESLEMAIQRRRESNLAIIIRHQGAFSSLANVGYENSPDERLREYGRLLIRERDTLIRCLEAGIGLQIIISPFIAPGDATERISGRYRVLLGFLKRSAKDLECCDVVISPFLGPNLFFIGEDILIEGHKTSIQRGFGFSMVHRMPDLIRHRLQAYDALFESARQYTLDRYGLKTSPLNDRLALRQAVINAIESLLRNAGHDTHPTC